MKQQRQKHKWKKSNNNSDKNHLGNSISDEMVDCIKCQQDLFLLFCFFSSFFLFFSWFNINNIVIIHHQQIIIQMAHFVVLNPQQQQLERLRSIATENPFYCSFTCWSLCLMTWSLFSFCLHGRNNQKKNSNSCDSTYIQVKLNYDIYPRG